MTDAQITTLIDDNILDGGRRTTAEATREVLDAINDNKQNIDGKDQPDGYLSVDSNGDANMSLIKLTGYTSGAGTVQATDTVLQAIQKLDGNSSYKSRFQSFADVGNGTTVETDLAVNAILVANFLNDGDQIHAIYGGTFLNHATATRQLRLYFNSQVIFDSTALTVSTGTSGWSLNVTIIRVNVTRIRYTITLCAQNASVVTTVAVGELTGQNLATSNNLTLTGQAAAAGAATNDIVLKMSSVNNIKI